MLGRRQALSFADSGITVVPTSHQKIRSDLTPTPLRELIQESLSCCECCFLASKNSDLLKGPARLCWPRRRGWAWKMGSCPWFYSPTGTASLRCAFYSCTCKTGITHPRCRARHQGYSAVQCSVLLPRRIRKYLTDVPPSKVPSSSMASSFFNSVADREGHLQHNARYWLPRATSRSH